MFRHRFHALLWTLMSVGSAVFMVSCELPFREMLYSRPTPAPGQVMSIRFSSPNNTPPSLTFQAGISVAQTVAIAFTPAGATNKNVAWTSAKGKVTITATGPNTATVAPVTGTGAPVAGDTDTITATPADGGTALQKTCAVVFTGPSSVPVTGIALDQSALSVATGAQGSIKVTISPTGSSVQTVSWAITSSSGATATFLAGGTTTTTSADQSTVTIVGGTPGTGVTVTATLVDGGNTFTKTCAVTVTGIPVSTVTINQPVASLLEGETASLTATVLPANASNPTITWSSSNTAAVSVNPTTGQLQAQVGAGGSSAIITATAGGKTATLNVSVVAPAQVPALGAPASPGGGFYAGATMALDPSTGFPVIAYSDNLGNGHVQKWLGGGNWSTDISSFNVGAFQIDSTLATNLALAVDSAGNPTVAYISSASSAATVTQWNGAAWNPLNGAASSISSYLALGIGQYHSLTGSNLPDTPALAMASNEGSSPLYATFEVYDKSLGSWALPTTGTLSYAGPSVTSTSLEMNPKYDFVNNPGVPFALVASEINGQTLSVYGFPSAQPVASLSVPGASYLSLGVDGQGLANVAYTDSSGTAHLAQQSGTNFNQLALLSGTADHLSLVFDPRPGATAAYLSYRNVSSGGTASLWKYEGGVGTVLIADVSGTGAVVQGTKLVMSATGHLYYMYESNGAVVVKDIVR